jgi:hypothetical protein
MTRYDSFFIKLAEDSYLTEDGWRIEVKAVDGFLIWAKPSSGYYNQPCDRVYLGIVERAHTHGFEYTILMVRDLSVSEVSPVEDGSIAEQLCFRQTALFLDQVAQLERQNLPARTSPNTSWVSLGTPVVCEASRSEKSNWRKEGF